MLCSHEGKVPRNHSEEKKANTKQHGGTKLPQPTGEAKEEVTAQVRAISNDHQVPAYLLQQQTLTFLCPTKPTYK